MKTAIRFLSCPVLLLLSSMSASAGTYDRLESVIGSDNVRELKAEVCKSVRPMVETFRNKGVRPFMKANFLANDLKRAEKMLMKSASEYPGASWLIQDELKAVSDAREALISSRPIFRPAYDLVAQQAAEAGCLK